MRKWPEEIGNKTQSWFQKKSFMSWSTYISKTLEAIIEQAFRAYFCCSESFSLMGLPSPRTSFWSYGQLSGVKQQVCTRLRILRQKCLKVTHSVFTCKRVLTETQRATLEKLLWRFFPVEKVVFSSSVLQLHTL